VTQVLVLLFAWATYAATATGANQRPEVPSPARDGEHAVRADSDSVTRLRDSLMTAVLQSIAGRETQPAESVFSNIRSLGKVPAGSLLRIMNIGFGRSLGVGCDHCHVVGKWDEDSKPQKQIARDMWAMMGKINTDLLPGIPNLRGPRPTVNCTTCHRGQVKPALNLP
jgi:hypothetical protein